MSPLNTCSRPINSTTHNVSPRRLHTRLCTGVGERGRQFQQVQPSRSVRTGIAVWCFSDNNTLKYFGVMQNDVFDTGFNIMCVCLGSTKHSPDSAIHVYAFTDQMWVVYTHIRTHAHRNAHTDTHTLTQHYHYG